MLCIWLQRAQAAEAESKRILKHSKEQQARLEEMESQLLSRPPSMGTLQPALQGSVSGDSETSMQLLAQVLPDLLRTICQFDMHAVKDSLQTPLFIGLR